MSQVSAITGVVCGVRVKAAEEGPTMREIRQLDKLIDELAKGKAMEKIFREVKGNEFGIVASCHRDFILARRV